MATKVFRAKELRDALTNMRNDLGPNARILAQRQLPHAGRGILGWLFPGDRYEIVATDDPPAPEQKPAIDNFAMLEEELADLKSKLTQLVHSANLSRLPRTTRALGECYELLCDRGTPPDLAQKLVLAARDELSPAAQNRADSVEAAVRRQIERQVNTRSPHPTGGAGPLVIFLFGQAGVGKTTTLLKLATRQSMFDDRRVLLLNADIARPASQVQLEAIAQNLGLETDAVGEGAAGLHKCLEKYADFDAIFVDTPGYSRLNRAGMRELESMARTASRRRTFLVLNASTSLEEMNQILQGFRTIGMDGIILTKLDETDIVGAAVALACQSAVPVAYLTAGRRIPDDIYTATSELISALIFEPRFPQPDELMAGWPKKTRHPTPQAAITDMGGPGGLPEDNDLHSRTESSSTRRRRQPKRAQHSEGRIASERAAKKSTGQGEDEGAKPPG